MEANESQQHHPLSSYFTATAGSAVNTTGTATILSGTNGLVAPNNSISSNNNNSNADTSAAVGGASMLYPHSVGPSSTAVTSAPVEHPAARRKRGRPRKYGTPEQALAAKKTAASSNSLAKNKSDAASSSSPLYSGSSKKSQQLLSLGNGQGFAPHVISVAAGEDVGQKLMFFMQQSKRDVCILSASGSISNASLRQPATSGGNITYEGRFEIISLSGSYIRTDIGGRTGGLSVCLSNTDGQIIGGGVGGPLKAAGPVQVIVGSFLLENKKDINIGIKGDASSGKLSSPVGAASVSNILFRSPVESPGRNPVDHQAIAGNSYIIQQQGMHTAPSRTVDWRESLDVRATVGYDLTGTTLHGAHQSPENGDYDQLAAQ
ncbi:hypothetical protein K2173_006939 [Erythroxylum novogranatense]|uniref:AT-hook motif nuclear-localized protein n=1 Tax=Erythroxylum novogranatense TaxID=1862640 RepID=A0AAV8SYM9_9ROSI|nr:hypothetical protein K2173_006939 [Erythroxylum novogranatense]